MKIRIFLSKMMLVAVMLSATTGVAAQNNGEVRVALKGNAYMVGNEKGLGLEVNGKLVVAKNYVNFQTDSGETHFAVEAKDGKFGVCDSKGSFIYKCTYYKTQITGDLIRLQTTANSEPKFYRTASPMTEEKVTAVDPNAFNPEISAVHELTVKKAKAIAEQDPFTAFEFKTNSRGRQELYVDGKKLFEARTFSLISTYDYWKRTTCWAFIVTDRVPNRGEAYGMFILSIFKKDGKKGIETLLSIPLEYRYISPSPTGNPAAICTTFSGAEKYFTWYGDPILPNK
jgi:hypothetical protein